VRRFHLIPKIYTKAVKITTEVSRIWIATVESTTPNEIRTEKAGRRTISTGEVGHDMVNCL